LRCSAIRPEIRWHQIEGQNLNQLIRAEPQTRSWGVIRKLAPTKDLPITTYFRCNNKAGCPILRLSEGWEVL
jgi:hypothetical protein